MNYILTRFKKYFRILIMYGPSGVFQTLREFFKAKKKSRIKFRPERKKDFLFISGCPGAPKRYRCDFQAEQLRKHGLTGDVIDGNQFTLDLVKFYSIFIFFRIPYSVKMHNGLRSIKESGKFAAYDIDDIIFEPKNAQILDEVKAMSPLKREKFVAGMYDHQKFLKEFDFGICTTDALKKEMSKYIPVVLVNRNFPGKALRKLHESKVRSKSNKISIGYFSGSYTHNSDFNMIKEVLYEVLAEHKNVELWLTGHIDPLKNVPKEISHQLIIKDFLDWHQFPKLVSSVDINLAPLVDNRFNRGKSEIKFLEAALSHVPTIASKLPAFEFAIEDGKNGYLARNTSEWRSKLKKLITDRKKREKIAIAAYDSLWVTYKEILSGENLYNFLQKNV